MIDVEMVLTECSAQASAYARGNRVDEFCQALKGEFRHHYARMHASTRERHGTADGAVLGPVRVDAREAIGRPGAGLAAEIKDFSDALTRESRTAVTSRIAGACGWARTRARATS